jgi:hypothetical protein
MFNIYLGIYIVVAILVIAGGTYKLMDQTIAAFLFFVGSVVVFIIFGLRWFNDKGVFSKTPVQWPPNINTCPDFLTYYKRTSGGTKVDTCIDLIGVSRNSSIKVFPKTGIEPTTDDYYFALATTSTDDAQRNQELCQKAIAAGLTWEGITNGESCTIPDSDDDSGGTAPKACPTKPVRPTTV